MFWCAIKDPAGIFLNFFFQPNPTVSKTQTVRIGVASLIMQLKVTYTIYTSHATNTQTSTATVAKCMNAALLLEHKNATIIWRSVPTSKDILVENVVILLVTICTVGDIVVEIEGWRALSLSYSCKHLQHVWWFYMLQCVTLCYTAANTCIMWHKWWFYCNREGETSAPTVGENAMRIVYCAGCIVWCAGCMRPGWLNYLQFPIMSSFSLCWHIVPLQ